MGSSSFHIFIYARSEQCGSGPIYTTTNTQRIRIYPSKWNPSWSKFHRIQDVYMANMPKKTKLYSRFSLLRIIRTHLFTRVQIRSVFRFVQSCCKFTQVNAFTPCYKRVEAYLGNYLSNFFCVLIFIRIDRNLHIASKLIKLIRTNIYIVLQFIRVNLPSVNGALIGGPTYLLII